MNTIIYLTDPSLDEKIAESCRKSLKEAAGDIPIVSVSQQPLDFGKNVCLGEIGRSWMNLYKALLAGIDAAETENIVICEHDCMYTHEHLSFTPPTDDKFYYNSNHWLVQWHGNHPEMEGMYSYWPGRIALSQLVCNKELLRKSTEEIMRLLEMGLKVDKGMRWYGEPGVTSDKLRDYVANLKKAADVATGGTSHQLQRYLKEYVSHYDHTTFATELPNLDIRHGSNFTGAKRGNKRTMTLPHWGEFAKWMS